MLIPVVQKEKIDAMTVLAPQYKWIDGDGVAFGSPGLAPRWTSSAKDAVGTAYSASSRAWYTVSHGILNEVYYPTIDRPQIRDMQLLVTDGETFFHEERKDLNHDFEYVDSDSLAVKVRNSDPNGRYTITKVIINDPHYPVVLTHIRIEGDQDLLDRGPSPCDAPSPVCVLAGRGVPALETVRVWADGSSTPPPGSSKGRSPLERARVFQP